MKVMQSHLGKRLNIALAIGLFIILAIIMYVFIWHRSEEIHEPVVLFVTSSEARVKLNELQDFFLLDVRTNAEFASRRIPDAVNIPHLMITQERGLLPSDRHTPIFVYCRTGVRAATAANTLLELGYTNIIVFPGMMTWVYEIVTG